MPPAPTIPMRCSLILALARSSRSQDIHGSYQGIRPEGTRSGCQVIRIAAAEQPLYSFRAYFPYVRMGRLGAGPTSRVPDAFSGGEALRHSRCLPRHWEKRIYRHTYLLMNEKRRVHVIPRDLVPESPRPVFLFLLSRWSAGQLSKFNIACTCRWERKNVPKMGMKSVPPPEV